MEKTFEPKSVEPRWRDRWDELKIGHADASSSKPHFSISLPPPNITGALHCGHAVSFSVQDTLCRYRRMLGDEVEWTPGTDHAAIATNAVIERQLASEGTSKEELGKEKFLERVDQWYEKTGGRIYEQMRQMAFTCDWDRARFTLDKEYVRAIRVVFKQLFEEGLIYRGPRIVNWCPFDRSAISDEEVEWVERTDKLTHLRYPVETGDFIVVATVRPETMLGDTAVAVAPGDKRYAHLVGKNVTLPLTGRVIPIIEDEAVRTEFGTGALKVTPAHDPADYDIGQRHSLPLVSVIDPAGNINYPELPQFHGMPSDAARKAVTEALRSLGAVEKEEDYVHEVGHCDRCHHMLEPQVSEQWWVKMKTLAAPGIAAAESGEIKFHPARYKDVYLNWMRNIRDWCISRQIWLGHEVPVSRCPNEHIFAWIEKPSVCPDCGSGDLIHDPDVMDTWFSSWLWPFAIYGWPDNTPDLQAFYPTNVLGTAREIIYLWVARMIMSGLKFTGKNPFTDVVINATIMATDGSRMQKSKGNVIDPLDISEKYGTDALRAWTGAVGTSGQDVRFDEDRIASYQRFANKLWNATRVLVLSIGDGENVNQQAHLGECHLLPEDRWIVGKANECIRQSDRAFELYRFHDAMDRLYQTVWHDFCDNYLEIIKPRLRGSDEDSKRAAGAVATHVLDILLRLLHPFMPYVTEECAQRLPGAKPSLQMREWPQVDPQYSESDTQREIVAVDQLLDLAQALRAARQESGFGFTDPTPHHVVIKGGDEIVSAGDRVRILAALAPWTSGGEADGIQPVAVVSGDLHALLYVGRNVAHVKKQITDLENRIKMLTSQLENRQFVERARPEVVAEKRDKLAEAERQLSHLRGQGE